VAETIDARGLSCPQPVIMALNGMRRPGSGELEILVDAVVSKENVSRAVASRGWEVSEIRQEGDVFRIAATRR
jgi:TusA-related sulfurtransferase